MGRQFLIEGMQGLGDNIHQRAVIRQLLPEGQVWLRTPWPCMYHDLIDAGLRLCDCGSTLRTQAKNADRERAAFVSWPVHAAGAEMLRVSYTPEMVRRCGSVLGAMSAQCGVSLGDFRLPVPHAWRVKASTWIEHWRPSRPLLITRPLVNRREWGGCLARNPDHVAYTQILAAIRRDFFVVSIADLVDGVEWIVSDPREWDVACHAGELDAETLAALIEMSSLVYASPGFAVPMAQAVETPVICIFGGYENAKSFSAGARFSPYLGIDPVRPCDCFRHDHACQKAIDLPAAIKRVREFAHAALDRSKTIGCAADRLDRAAG